MTPILDSIGPYQILGELGSGGMGVVYLARDPRLGRVVAVKVIQAGGTATADARRRLRIEAEAVGSLDHPGIVPILDVGDSAAEPYLALKFIPGGSLAERLAESRLSASDAARLMAQVARAVDHAHQRGVLHRDLKPSNILLDERGQPHLTDFGLAKLATLDLGLTLSHAPVGTCGYMAPEIARSGARAATIASDIYSLGAVLFELMTGRPPYVTSGFADFLSQVDQGELPRPLRVRRETRSADADSGTGSRPSRFLRDLEIICLRCLNRDPRQRYPSSAALAEDLERLLRGELIVARAPTLLECAAAWIVRHRAATAAGAAVLLSVLAGLGATWWQLKRAERFLGESERANHELLRQDIRRSLQEFQVKSTNAFRRDALHDLTLLHRRHPTNRLVAARLWMTLLERHHPLRRLAPLIHTHEVWSTAFTPDGTQLLTASVESPFSVHLWDLGTGAHLGTVPHDISVAPIVMDRTGARLVCVDPDGRLRVWSLPGLTGVDGPWTQFPQARQAAISPSGTTLAATDSGRRLSVWSIGERTLAWETELEDGPHRLCFSSDGRHLVAAGGSGRATLLEAAGGGPRATINSSIGALKWIEASPDGRGVLLVGDKGVWFETDPLSGNHHLEFSWTNQTIQAARISPDGEHVAIATHEGWLGEYSLRTREPTRRNLDLGRFTDDLTYSEVNSDLALTMGDGVAWFFPAEPDRRRPEPVKMGVFAYQIRFSPDGRSVAAPVSDRKAHVFSMPPQLEADPVMLVQTNVVKWAASPTGTLVAILDSAGTVGVRRLTAEATFEPWLHPDAPIRSLDFSPSGRWLMVRDNNGLAQLIPVTHPGAPLRRLQHDRGLVPAFGFDREEHKLILATETQAHVWDISAEPPRREAVFDVSRAQRFVFSPDGSRVALRAADWIARLYDTRTWKQLPDLLAHTGPVNAIQFSQDGRWVATGSQDRTARVWRASDGQPLTPMIQTAFNGLALAFHPDGSELFTCGYHSIRRWQIPGGDPDPRELAASTGSHHLRYSRDGRQLLSAGGGIVWLWDTDSGTPLMDPIPAGPLAFPQFSTDGRHFLIVDPPVADSASGDDGRLTVIRLASPEDIPDSESLLAMAQLCLDGELNAKGGLVPLDASSLADLYRKADPILRTVRPSRIRQLRLLKPEIVSP
ncbi:MAG: protein kinase [Verrucomicrobiae bacterium]|nr:protein kinase [Verrucomicrobiae bacterium]